MTVITPVSLRGCEDQSLWLTWSLVSAPSRGFPGEGAKQSLEGEGEGGDAETREEQKFGVSKLFSSLQKETS